MNVIFDIGKVLIDWDPRHLYQKMFADQAEMEWFLANVCTMAWNLEGDKGTSYGELGRALAKRHPDYAAQIEAYDTRWQEMVPGAIDESVALLHELDRRGVPLYAITNWNQDKFRETRIRFPFLNLFRDIVVLGEEGIIKPDPAIFQMCLERNGLTAGESLFIDDSLKNVTGAEAVGIRGHHFTSPAALRAALRGLGLI
jgi:2-haloacid dehalogenase